jgi:hypothetical protein
MKTLAIADLNCAATLAALGCRLLSTDQQGQRTFFYFDDSEGASTAASLRFINNEPIPVRNFVSAYRELRSVAFAARRSQP